jgi:hypothetical protein
LSTINERLVRECSSKARTPPKRCDSDPDQPFKDVGITMKRILVAGASQT